MSSGGKARLVLAGCADYEGDALVPAIRPSEGGASVAWQDYVWSGFPPPVTEIPYAWLTPPARFRPDQPRNVATVTRTSGSAARKQNAASVGSVGERPFTATVDSQVDADPGNYAQWIVDYYTDVRQRMPTLTLNLVARTDVECWRILGRRIGDRIRITDAPGDDVQLMPNPYFEVGVSGYTGVGGALAQSSTWSRSGSSSLRLTPDGVSTDALALSDPVAVVGGQTYTVDGWLFSAVGYGTVGLNVNWYDAAGNYLSTGALVTSLTAGVSQRFNYTAVAPANAASARVHPVEGGTPPASAVLYADEVTLTGPNLVGWPDGVTDLVIEGVTHHIGVDVRWVTWNTSPVIGSAPGVAGPWFRTDSSRLDGTDLVPF